MLGPISNDESTSGDMKKLMVEQVIFSTNERQVERRIKKVEGEFPIHHSAGVPCHAFWKFTTLDPSKVLSKGPFARFFRGSPVIIIIHTVCRHPLISESDFVTGCPFPIKHPIPTSNPCKFSSYILSKSTWYKSGRLEIGKFRKHWNSNFTLTRLPLQTVRDWNSHERTCIGKLGMIRTFET